MVASFARRLEQIQQRKRSNLALWIGPRLLQMPLPMQKYDDPYLPFGKAIIDATQPVVCAYVFDLASYLALGAAGAIALERTIGYARANGDTLIVLHGPFATPDYVEAAGAGGFHVDAVTLVDEQHLEAYGQVPGLGMFVVREGENPVIIPLPGAAGAFWPRAELVTLLTEDGRRLELRLAGPRVLYAGRGDDFAQRVRDALEALRA